MNCQNAATQFNVTVEQWLLSVVKVCVISHAALNVLNISVAKSWVAQYINYKLTTWQKYLKKQSKALISKHKYLLWIHVEFLSAYRQMFWVWMIPVINNATQKQLSENHSGSCQQRQIPTSQIHQCQTLAQLFSSPSINML